MEMMILSILAPQLHCEWRLPSYQVALVTSVGQLSSIVGFSHKLQAKIFVVSLRWCLPGCVSAPLHGGTWLTDMAEEL